MESIIEHEITHGVTLIQIKSTKSKFIQRGCTQSY